MKITVKVKDGGNICFTVSPSDSVNELKTKIHEKEKLLNQQQHLIYDGESLNDEHALSDYNIQEGSVLLIVNKERSLLLTSSIIFDNSSLLDRIHQSNIDLKNESQEEDVLNLLNEAISYLDEDIKPNVAIELFFLISNCFMQYPDQCFKLFNKRFQKGKITANHIIAFAEVLSKLAIDLPNVSINDHEDFINNAFQQIQKSQDNTLTILGNEIPQHFKNIFISDIILLLEPTDKIVIKFSPIIINVENSATKVNYFIKKTDKYGLIKLIPDSLFLENSYFLNLTSLNKVKILQLSTEQTFRKLLTIIKDVSSNSSFFCKTILNRLISFDISSDKLYIHKLLMAIDEIILSQNKIEYFEKHNIKLPNKLVPIFLPKSPICLTLFLHPEELPEYYISYALMEAKKLSIYRDAFKSNYLHSPVLSKIDFWKHIMVVISHSDEELDNDLMSRFAFYFQSFMNPQQFDNVYDRLIFDEDSLPNEKQSLFLLKLLENMEHNCLNFTKDKLMKFLMKKEIPCKNLCSLFTFREYPMKDPNFVELYIFVFSNNRNKYTFPFNLDISYEPILSKVYSTFKYYINKIVSYGTNENNDPNEILTQFIKQNNDTSLIRDFSKNINLFKFITASLFYADETRSFNVKGLTKENALPFYAIALNHINEKTEEFFAYSGENFLKYSSKEMLDALIESIKCLENCTSALLNESINAILSKGHRLFYYDCIQLKTIFDILCDFCIKGSYQADKIQFINIVFFYSCINQKNLNMKPYVLTIQKYGIHLFNFIMQHKGELITAKRTFYLNLSIFNVDEIKNSFEHELQKSTSDADLFQTIFFYTECCKDSPILKVDKVTDINRIFEKCVEEEKWDDFATITLFMLDNHIDVNFEIIKERKIPHNLFTKLLNVSEYRNIDNYLFQILSNPELENNLDNDIVSFLFNFTMEDISVIYEYVTANLDILSNDLHISYEMILQLKPHLYKLFKDHLIFVLKNSYDFDQKTKLFIKKINVKLSEKFSKSECSIIEKLYETKSYQSFICLHYISSCFPFHFDPDTSSNNKSHYIKVVDIVLPALNCLSFIYDDQNTEDKTNNLKTAISALSFLYSCLNSTKFISVFVLWLFENITSLTESQIIFMSTILHFLLNNEYVRIFILGYGIKYNFLDIMNDLLLRDIPNKELKSFYINTLYNLLKDYLSLISSTFPYDNILFIDGIRNGSISNPFEIWFNFSSVVPVYLNKLEFYIPKKNEFNQLIKEFSRKINPNIFLWISTEYSKELDENEISDLLSFFKDEKSTFIKEKLPSMPSKKTIKTQRYLLSQPFWAYHFINGTEQFPITLEHYEYLTNLINKLNEINDESKDNSTEENAEVLSYYNLYDWLNNQICPIKLFRTVLDYHLYSEKTDDISTKLLDFLSSNSKYRKYLHQLVNETLLQIETKFPLKSRVFYYRILHIFAILVGKNRNNDEDIFQGDGNKLFEYLLSPYLSESVSYTAKYLSILNCELLIQSTHIIGYIYAFCPYDIPIALDLLSKLDEENVKNIIPIIQNEYKKEIKSDHLNYNNMSHYLKDASFLVKSDASFLMSCLIKCINKYKNGIKDAYLLDFIIELFNFMAPKRDKYQIEYSPRSDEIDFTQSIFDRDQLFDDDDNNNELYHTPEQFFLQGSSFWESVYERYFGFLCEILKEDDHNLEKLTFLHDYYELVPFKSRFKYFNDQIESLENCEKAKCFLIKM